MMGRRVKAAFYQFAGPLMAINGYLYRVLRSPKTGAPRVHLGPGQDHYLPGWINVDANAFTAKCDVWADLRNRLPFRAGSVGAFYSHHVIEHLPDMAVHFRDVYRCLQPGGVYRLAGPNGDGAIRKFLEGDLEWFSDFPDNRKSIGGRFDNFIFCKNEHLAILTESYLRELLISAGFTKISLEIPTFSTGHPLLFGDCLGSESESNREAPHTLVLEATKYR
jgi:predicted SAM-dependent methyltransferase